MKILTLEILCQIEDWEKTITNIKNSEAKINKRVSDKAFKIWFLWEKEKGTPIAKSKQTWFLKNTVKFLPILMKQIRVVGQL